MNTEPKWRQFAATSSDYGAPTDDYSALWQWSSAPARRFWRALWEFFDVTAHAGPAPATAEFWPNRRCQDSGFQASP